MRNAGRLLLELLELDRLGHVMGHVLLAAAGMAKSGIRVSSAGLLVFLRVCERLGGSDLDEQDEGGSHAKTDPALRAPSEGNAGPLSGGVRRR